MHDDVEAPLAPLRLSIKPSLAASLSILPVWPLAPLYPSVKPSLAANPSPSRRKAQSGC